MESVRQIQWIIEPKTAPLYRRRCPKCGCMRSFCNSEKFRVNAHAKAVDVWLIYKCTHCDSTWNISLYSKTNPKAISRELFQRFLDNDRRLAWDCAFSRDVMRQNQITLEEGGAELELAGERILNPERPALIKVEYPFACEARVMRIVKEGMPGVSRTYLEALQDQGRLRFDPPSITLKSRRREPFSISLNLEIDEQEHGSADEDEETDQGLQRQLFF